MTDHTDLIKTQADRDAAADYWKNNAPEFSAELRDGVHDHDPEGLPQAFARHRIAALADQAAEIARLTALVGEARGVLEPFAAMGRVIEARALITFGRVPPDREIVCESSGEVGMGILVMGHFRDAANLLPNAPGWGGQYKPLAKLDRT